jgi:hypothetical protein
MDGHLASDYLMEELGNLCLVTYMCCEEEASTQYAIVNYLVLIASLQEVVWVSNSPPLGNSTS